MGRPGVEEEIAMNQDLEREFGHVKEGQDRIERHLEQQDRQLSEHFKKFNQHVIDDNGLFAIFRAHLAEHETANKHRWVIVSGIFLTAASTLGILAVEIAKHFFMKG